MQISRRGTGGGRDLGFGWEGGIGRIFSYIFFLDIGNEIKILPIRHLPIFQIFKKLAIFQLPIY